jgi:hypothetical protein
MKKTTLFVLFFVVSLSANAAPTLTWDSYTTSTFANASGSGSSSLTGDDILTLGAFSHDWNFSSDEDANATVGAFSFSPVFFLTDVVVSLNGTVLNELTSYTTSISSPFAPIIGPSTISGVVTYWYDAFSLVAGQQNTLNVAGIVSDTAFFGLGAAGYSFGIDASANSVTATPLPAAAWLFISAILGVGGLASRRKTLPVEGLTA